MPRYPRELRRIMRAVTNYGDAMTDETETKYMRAHRLREVRAEVEDELKRTMVKYTSALAELIVTRRELDAFAKIPDWTPEHELLPEYKKARARYKTAHAMAVALLPIPK